MANISFRTRLKNAWNVFANKDQNVQDFGRLEEYSSSSRRPDRIRIMRFGADTTTFNSVINRIAMDVAAVNIRHVRVDNNDRFLGVIDSPFNRCLSLEANGDQTSSAFIQDLVVSMLDEGCVAVVPVVTSDNPNSTSSYGIENVRVGKIVQWYPSSVRVSLYNEWTGERDEVTLSKNNVAIIENPFYSIMNEPNSTLQRLVRKLHLLDVVDEATSSQKLDIIVQVPYSTRMETRKADAEKRRRELEEQLSQSRYGVGYIDATERVTQLNRPVENNLLTQIEYLTKLFYSQTGISQEVMDGTADERKMLNYNNRTIKPILSAITDEFKRKFLTRTAITQGQSIKYFTDPFSLVPVDNLAEIADKFTRNEILSSNEVRQILGMKPSDDPRADQLRNSNISDSKTDIAGELAVAEEQEEMEEVPNSDVEEEEGNSQNG